MRRAGVEPARKNALDLKSNVSTIPPPSHISICNNLNIKGIYYRQIRYYIHFKFFG